MTTIQVFALIGVFLIGAICGGYALFKFYVFALQHSTVIGLAIATWPDGREQIVLKVQNPTPTLGARDWLLGVAPDVAALVGAASKLAATVDDTAAKS